MHAGGARKNLLLADPVRRNKLLLEFHLSQFRLIGAGIATYQVPMRIYDFKRNWAGCCLGQEVVEDCTVGRIFAQGLVRLNGSIGMCALPNSVGWRWFEEVCLGISHGVGKLPQGSDVIENPK